MIRLVLIAGFLGAGKTTLLKRLLGRTGRAGVIVNDFGPVNIDAALIADSCANIVRLQNGSVFCACIKQDFISALIDMSAEDIDTLYIEASGLADPADMQRILRGIEGRLHTPYEYLGVICVVDAATYPDMSEILEALSAQAEYAGAFIINRADLAAPAQLAATRRALSAINPDAPQYTASYCNVDIPALLNALSPSDTPARDGGNTVESRPVSFTLRSVRPVKRAELLALTEELARYSYRIKGFALCETGVLELSAAFGRVSAEEYTGALPEDGTVITVISAEGIRLLSRITAATAPLNGAITL